jgi:hypothetical protein
MAAGQAGRTILSVSLGFKDRPTSGSPDQMYRYAEPAKSHMIKFYKKGSQEKTLPHRLELFLLHSPLD